MFHLIFFPGERKSEQLVELEAAKEELLWGRWWRRRRSSAPTPNTRSRLFPNTSRLSCSWLLDLFIHPSIFYNEFRHFSPPSVFVTTSLTHLNDLWTVWLRRVRDAWNGWAPEMRLVAACWLFFFSETWLKLMHVLVFYVNSVLHNKKKRIRAKLSKHASVWV